MGTSLSYNFANVDVNRVIRDAYAQCGINAALISGWQYRMANESLNFLMTSWLSKRGLNLFTVEQNMLEIIQGQRLYPLPTNTSKILECVFANANQIVIPGSSYLTYGLSSDSQSVQVSGNAESVFTTTPSPCTQTLPNGSIQCNFPVNQPQPIQYIGVQTNTTQSYTLSIQCSIPVLPIPGAPAGIADLNWQTLLQIPTQTYYKGLTKWFPLSYSPTACSWRIQETNGAILDIAQIQLDIPYKSLQMSAVGRDIYTFFPTNSQQGPSTTYYVNRAGQPTLDVWTTPDSQWQFFVYNRVRSIQDAGDYTNSLDMTPRFLEAATTGLAARLARLYALDKSANLQALADQLFLEAAKEDTENVNMQMSIDQNGYYGS